MLSGSVCMCLQDNKKNVPEIRDLGLTDYRETLELQKELRQKRCDDEIGDTVLLVEHLPVITLGVREEKNKFLVTCEQLKKENIDVVEIRRGGGATAHNPGQLVIYPIFSLGKLKLGVSDYVHKLEDATVKFLKKLNVESERKKGFPGIWTGEKKIASVGVRVSRLVTFHGLAVNIYNDLSIFDKIIPCGIEGVEMTSVYHETKVKYSMEKAKKIMAEILMETFSHRDTFDYEKSQ
jgi:lipoate-protein ligase B